MKNETKLLNCPFCSGEAECYTVQTMQRETGFVVKCKNLDCVMCSGGTLRQKPEFAIKAWNTRKPMERILERLEEVYDVTHENYMKDRDLITLGKKYGLEHATEIIREEGGIK